LQVFIFERCGVPATVVDAAAVSDAAGAGVLAVRAKVAPAASVSDRAMINGFMEFLE
jgi:hypothetical protein